MYNTLGVLDKRKKFEDKKTKVSDRYQNVDE